MMTNIELANKLKNIAKNYKTLYVMGCFGAPMTATNKKRYTQNHSYNRQAARTAMINAASADTFGFDCVCLIKGVLWGWSGDKNAIYGGASYASNGVPDIGADTMITVCKNVSTDFSKIEIGEAVWMEGHIGVYVGNGLAVECTPRWKNKVQITACNRNVSGYDRRNWTKHGKLPYITYTQQTTPSADTAVKGIDVSKWQGNIDFDKVAAAGCEFVIIRLGGYVDGCFTDTYFKSNIKKAKEAGLKVGIYWYSQENSPELVMKNMDYLFYELGEEALDLPIYFDWEDFTHFQNYKMSVRDLNNMFSAFCLEAESRGYRVMLSMRSLRMPAGTRTWTTSPTFLLSRA